MTLEPLRMWLSVRLRRKANQLDGHVHAAFYVSDGYGRLVSVVYTSGDKVNVVRSRQDFLDQLPEQFSPAPERGDA